MRRRPATSLFSFAVFVFVFVFLAASFSFRASRDFLPSAALNSMALRRPLTSRAVSELLGSPPPPPLDAVLLPDWEVLLVLSPESSPSAAAAAATDTSLFCLFHTGDSSPARRAGAAAFRCSLPHRLRRIRPFYAPRLIAASASSSSSAATGHDFDFPRREMIRWSMPVAYQSFSTEDEVIVFAKGINRRKHSVRPAADIKCVFSPASGGPALAATPATSSAQEAFRCPHPSVRLPSPSRVSLAVALEAAPIATVAEYRRPSFGGRPPSRSRVGICACTMVFNAAKFLPEWVAYHAAVGVERFFLYDNASEDELDPVVKRLGSEGYDVIVRSWPWPKTQEAGFSHCAVSNRHECEWMAFIDVDEFILAPAWSNFNSPNRSMLGSLLAVQPEFGQVSIRCLEFGPSGQQRHPQAGVTQGYTCRRRAEQRHKSLVRLDAIDNSLINSIHHFILKDSFKTKFMGRWEARVNHYKYQAWTEFKIKFRRRVSTYVPDWKQSTSLGSQDRVPGLGFEAIEPLGWTGMFCEVNDTLLQETTQKWFGAVSLEGEYRMPWQN
ncbi:glycosyltransferase family 92 protein Os08g0121900-like [Curcuma longa]|uniref:glycosyltransferase family 92 protein Os08g0121900-like n=1 Tax=Curcuma longa TaxID=136217 RepID=UPI003D9F8C37